MVNTGMEPVEDTGENQKICRKYCGACPTYKRNILARYQPAALFCAHGTSSSPSKVKTMGCFCPACELFTEHGLVIGYFCAKR
jgi:hypothetical protein